MGKDKNSQFTKEEVRIPNKYTHTQKIPHHWLQRNKK